MFGFSKKRKTRQNTKANKNESNAGNGLSMLFTDIQKQNNLKKSRKIRAKTRSQAQKMERNNNTNSINVNSDRNEKKMKTLANIGLLSTYIQNRDVHGGDWARDLKSLKMMNSEIPERMEDFMKIWYAIDTYHDLMDGTRAPLLRTLIFTGASNQIQCIDNFLYGKTSNLEKLIDNTLKVNEVALQNAKAKLSARNALKTFAITGQITRKSLPLDTLKKTILSNLLSQVRQMPSNNGSSYMNRALVCERNMLSDIFDLNNIQLLQDAIKQGTQVNIVRKDVLRQELILTSSTQLSNSAVTETGANKQFSRQHIFIKNSRLNINGNIAKVSKVNNRGIQWFRQCVDEQLHHTFRNYCGVVGNRIKTVVIQIIPKKYKTPLVKYMVIHVDEPPRVPRYVPKSNGVVHIYGSRGLSVSELDELFSDQLKYKFGIRNPGLTGTTFDKSKRINTYDLWKDTNIRRFGWLITDIKRSQDSTQVSFIKELNKVEKKKNTGKKTYLLTQDILCACRCIIAKVGCVFESKGRYFIFSEDKIKKPDWLEYTMYS